MPKTEIDYSKTIIYKIQHIINNELLYIGHTTNFTKRKTQHKSKAISDKYKDTKQTKVYTMIRANGGWESFEMTPIKTVCCLNSVEALIEEEKCRVEFNANLNMIKAKTDKKEYDKHHRKLNKEHYKEYRQAHKDIRAPQIQAYYLAHREELLEYKKKYHEANKEATNARRSEKIACDCGCNYQLRNKARHLKSKQHLEAI